jgi:hypothetical protein
MKYRDRHVFLEQRDDEKENKNVKRDCVHFAMAIRKLTDDARHDRGLILKPPFLHS